MRIGELFSGYGGLGMGVQSVLGGDIAWHSEIDPGPYKILAHRYPDVPNLGDITAVDWTQVEPVDVLTGGFPCQDVSHAGKRLGMKPGTRSGLWSHMAYAIDQLRPRLVVAENVRGLLSAEAHSDLEPCPWCLGDDEPIALRALGGVLGDLADLGYDAAWHGLRAADVGAPHGRFRVFVVAWPATAGDAPVRGRDAARSAGRRGEPARPARGSGLALADAPRDGRHEGWPEPARLVGGSDAALGGDAAAHPQGSERRGTQSERVGARPDRAAEPGERAGVRSGAGAWGPYAPAVARWEHVAGRPAPAPTELGPKGSHRLSARAVEWLMGLPAGWVTEVPGITRNEALKALGNGVVPQQAAEGLRRMLGVHEAAA